MKVVLHGNWVLYAPKEPNPNAVPNTLYAKRVEDGVDWYEFVHPGDKFKDGSVVATVHNGVVGAAVYEADRLFPEGALLIEIQDYEGGSPQMELGGHFFDVNELTFSKDTQSERLVKQYGQEVGG